eukprot:SAG31_NODE_11857_length_991_cov_80.670404_1_plen_164_part_00
MPNYQNSKIYKLVDNTNGNVYYGSTTARLLCMRLAGHNASHRRFKKGEGTNCSSFQILENKDYTLSLVETYPCNSKDELYARERFYIENNDCVNLVLPGRPRKEWAKEYYTPRKKLERAKYIQTLNAFRDSWGGSFRLSRPGNTGSTISSSNNLLRIDVNLFA